MTDAKRLVAIEEQRMGRVGDNQSARLMLDEHARAREQQMMRARVLLGSATVPWRATFDVGDAQEWSRMNLLSVQPRHRSLSRRVSLEDSFLCGQRDPNQRAISWKQFSSGHFHTARLS